MHFSGSFFKSLEKNRRGRMPFATSSENWRSSRATFERILFRQYSGSLSRRPSGNRPCQKSPSTKTASFFEGKYASGVQGIPFRCFRYRKAGQNRFMSRKNRFSGSVFFDLIRRITSERFSGEKMSAISVIFIRPVREEGPLGVSTGAPGRNRTYILAFGGPYSIR